ncbi:hypothetical protein DNU06_07035 [Putridiphycobacter roseus]|uniref:CMP/dCMP-type deaminase domain-containing protein n=1 Tax=Putridiphycobacter roseus TaxID=2219161 RepID=A0A2W1NI22_9FLAO|nr:ATP-binding protein [Putridiphycobacter roseus]PZE17576.1 hypothetical protein DNU06_07035 [Putridiphycobacter roseus]
MIDKTNLRSSKFSKHIKRILDEQLFVILPSIGALMLESKTNKIVFNPHLSFNDGNLVDFISKAESISKSSAQNLTNAFVSEIQNSLLKNNSFALKDFGTFHISDDGIMDFKEYKRSEKSVEKKDKRKDPKYYMQIAVDIMKSSIVERSKDNPSPHVGAVLVFPDGTFDTAYRGEFREGDHAEYTVMDKKNRHKDLSGCWIFATLEPCAPGARNTPKVSCAKRISNARISDVWYGIEDKNPTVNHGGIDHLEVNGVHVHQFSPEFHKEIEEANKEFMTWASIKNREAQKEKEINNRQKNSLILDQKAAETNMSSLSIEALQKFADDSNLNLNVSSEEFKQELKEMGLLEFNDKSNSYFPSGNAILLFGKRPRNKFPQAAIKAKVHFSSSKVGTETFDDALVLIPNQIEEWLNKVLPSSIDRSKFKAKQVSEFPPEVIREAIINAMIHRDYSLDGAKISLEIFSDKIIVKSPGKPYYPITIEAMRNFTANSYSRNKKLAFVFNEMDLMEESALGMDTYRSLWKVYDLPIPIIDYKNENIVVTFPRTVEAVMDSISKTKELNEEELVGFELVRTKGKVTRAQYETHFSFDKKKAERHLKRMVELGLILRKGSGPATYYEVSRQ